MRPTPVGAAAVLAALLLAAPARPAARPGVQGTYRLQGRASVDARPFPAEDEELHADAVLSPGARPGEVRIHLAGQGFACDLTASIDAAGSLTFARGQRCVADLRTDETEGRVEGQLASGSGRVDEEAISLDLAFSLSGTVRARAGSTLDTIGQALSIPGSGDAVPVRGQARGRAEGHRDHSRATQ